MSLFNAVGVLLPIRLLFLNNQGQVGGLVILSLEISLRLRNYFIYILSTIKKHKCYWKNRQLKSKLGNWNRKTLTHII